jgi:hypothetical protein
MPARRCILGKKGCSCGDHPSVLQVPLLSLVSKGSSREQALTQVPPHDLESRPVSASHCGSVKQRRSKEVNAAFVLLFPAVVKHNCFPDRQPHLLCSPPLSLHECAPSANPTRASACWMPRLSQHGAAGGVAALPRGAGGELLQTPSGASCAATAPAWLPSVEQTTRPRLLMHWGLQAGGRAGQRDQRRRTSEFETDC